MLRIPIKLPATCAEDGEQERAALEAALRKVLREPTKPITFTIHRRSVDAREKGAPLLVYSLDVEAPNEKRYRKRFPVTPKRAKPELRAVKAPSHPPVVVGMGPAGLFAALVLARAGAKPIVIEQGAPLEERIKDVGRFWKEGKLNPDSNVQFGEGGAGTFSDGKLTTQVNDPMIGEVLRTFVAHGAPEDILYKSKPHIGSDRLREVLYRMRKELIQLGAQIRFSAKLTDIRFEGGRLSAIVLGEEVLPASLLILAPGHSARETFTLLAKRGVPMEKKPFSMGLRIEHPQSIINAAQYGRAQSYPALGAADYKISHHSQTKRSAYSFCMCPGGLVVASSSEKGGVVTNGMSLRARNEQNANAALLVSVTPEDVGEELLGGIAFQRKWEQKAFELGGSDYCAPAQRAVDFLEGRLSLAKDLAGASYAPGVRPAMLEECLPDFVSLALKEALPSFSKKIHGFLSEQAILTGVETRSSSPLRILREENRESKAAGIFPCGEGAGYAGGITSSAVDGIKTALAVLDVLQKEGKDGLF